MSVWLTGGDHQDSHGTAGSPGWGSSVSLGQALKCSLAGTFALKEKNTKWSASSVEAMTLLWEEVAMPQIKKDKGMTSHT